MTEEQSTPLVVDLQVPPVEIDLRLWPYEVADIDIVARLDIPGNPFGKKRAHRWNSKLEDVDNSFADYLES